MADCAHLRMRKAINSDPVTPFSGKCVRKLRTCTLSNQLAARSMFDRLACDFQEAAVVFTVKKTDHSK